MQLTIPPSQLIEPHVEASGFTLVEEDDVAFSLRLCREVNRIYLDYQEGRLQATDAVQAGLSVTVEMLAVMSHAIRDGMPAMRITVAAAQTREILAVVFGQDPMSQPIDDRYRDRYRSLIADTAAQLIAPPTVPELTTGGIQHRSARRRWFSRRRG